jgi:flavin-dependent thymidylate synthase
MPLTVRLAGYNVDADLLRDTIEVLQKIERESGQSGSAAYSASEYKQLMDFLGDQIRRELGPESFTPETISAAYARISRDPKQVTELRRAARFSVARSRKSNETIIFGLGHSSVAEHACFNFDILGLSRYASEELQSHRLLSFTEKSQRYITLTPEYVTPPELVGMQLEAKLGEYVAGQFVAYDALFEALQKHFVAAIEGEPTKQALHEIENRAKEDARYLLPLACTTQMGMTANARSIEHVIRDLSDHPLAELRALSHALHGAVSGLAPSLVKYVSRADYPRKNREALRQTLPSDFEVAAARLATGPSATLVDVSPNGESVILKGLAFAAGLAYSDEMLTKLSDADTESLWRTIFEGMSEHDPAMRQFELASMTFEVTISASCFAQLKRHRMATVITQPYGLQDSAVLPPSIAEAGLAGEFEEAIERSREVSVRLAEECPLAAPYALTNAHTKRVLIQMNARELYHFARLRCDAEAQWEIRDLANQMIEHARKEWPRALMLACGKDQFRETYRRIFPESKP